VKKNNSFCGENMAGGERTGAGDMTWKTVGEHAETIFNKICLMITSMYHTNYIYIYIYIYYE